MAVHGGGHRADLLAGGVLAVHGRPSAGGRRAGSSGVAREVAVDAEPVHLAAAQRPAPCRRPGCCSRPGRRPRRRCSRCRRSGRSPCPSWWPLVLGLLPERRLRVLGAELGHRLRDSRRTRLASSSPSRTGFRRARSSIPIGSIDVVVLRRRERVGLRRSSRRAQLRAATARRSSGAGRRRHPTPFADAARRSSGRSPSATATLPVAWPGRTNTGSSSFAPARARAAPRRRCATPSAFASAGADEGRVVPGELGERVGQLLQPAVVGEPAVVDPVVAAEDELERPALPLRRLRGEPLEALRPAGDAHGGALFRPRALRDDAVVEAALANAARSPPRRGSP